MINLQEVSEKLTQKLAGLGQTNHKAGLKIERSAEIMDTVLNASQRDLAVYHVDQESRTARAIKAALQRIEDGSYGVCVDCDERISPARLNAVPEAGRCIGCQEDEDRRTAASRSLDQDLLLTA